VIRVYVVEDTIDDEGGSTLMITGHDDFACAGVSAIWHAMVDGYERMAKEHPEHVAFEAVVKKASPAPPSSGFWRRLFPL
jgi:hypothetical protein